MTWRFLPHATACLASGRLILLDTRQDRYFDVPPSVAGAMRAWLEHGGGGADESVIALLRHNRVLGAADPVPSAERLAVEVPRRLDSPIWRSGRPAKASLYGVARAVAETRLRLRFCSLQSVLDRRHAHVPRRAADEVQLFARSRDFDLARTFMPIRRRCLLDSLALATWLDQAGTTLVFGVTAYPFSAHCWLQSRDVVLNDSYDHVARYAPILIS